MQHLQVIDFQLQETVLSSWKSPTSKKSSKDDNKLKNVHGTTPNLIIIA